MPSGGAGRGQGRKPRIKPQEISGPLVTASVEDAGVAAKRNLCQRALEAMEDPAWKCPHNCNLDSKWTACPLCLIIWDFRSPHADGPGNRHWTIDQAQGKAVHHINHMHDKPIEHNVFVSIADTIQKARKRAGK